MRSIRFDFDLFLTLENCAPYELPKRIKIGKIRLNRMFNQRLYLALCLLEHSSRKKIEQSNDFHFFKNIHINGGHNFKLDICNHVTLTTCLAQPHTMC